MSSSSVVFGAIRLIIFSMYFFFSSRANLFAQWEPDQRLTYSGSCNSCYSNAKGICAWANAVHVVWKDGRDGNAEIYYKRSTDRGATWESERRLTNDEASSYMPCVANSQIGSVHVVWQDSRDPSPRRVWEIYYKHSSDGGTTWEADTRLSAFDSIMSYCPSLAVFESDVHVVWTDERDGNPEPYYKRSTDGGTTWGPDTRLTYNPAGSFRPSVAVSGSSVHVAWDDRRDGNQPKIFYKHSTDEGATWSGDTALTDTTIFSYAPSVAAWGPEVHVAWYASYNLGGSRRIFYKFSSDGGKTWGGDTSLTTHPYGSYDPSLAVSGSNRNVIWVDRRDSGQGDDIWYKRSTDWGATWSEDTCFTSHTDYPGTGYPSVAIEGSAVHTIWQDTRDVAQEIYYKRNLTGNSGVEETSEAGGQGLEVRLRARPNPFVSFAAIPGHENERFALYDISGRLVGTYKGDRIGEGLAPGVYFIKPESRNERPLRIVKVR